MTKATKRTLMILALVVGTLGVAGAKQDKPDAWITLKTKLALLTAEEVSGTEINVDTVNGRVTLHGKVDSSAEKTRAAEIAKRIEGTVEVKNLLQVVPDRVKPALHIEDEEIKKRIGAALDEAELNQSRINVQSVNNGVVLLSGKAVSLSDHVRAVQVARRVGGVRRVSSEIESPVQLTDRELHDMTEGPQAADGKPGGVMQSLSDSWITTATKMRLLANSTTPALDINVDTDQGVVTLFGVVPSDDAKKAAAVEVEKVNGVRSVVNSLQVVPESTREAVAARDEDLQKSVENTLAGLDSMKDIDVEVKNGVARLTGSVMDSADRLRASIVVRSTPGVRSVQNDLRIAAK